MSLQQPSAKASQSAAEERALSQDFHTAKLRIIMSPIIVGYILYANHWGSGSIDMRQLTLDILGFLHLAYAIFSFRYFFKRPQPNVRLRVAGTLTDHAGVILTLAVTGNNAVVVSWLPLFILTGVSLRFGSKLLIASYPVALLDLAIAYYVNPWWMENIPVAVGVALFTAIIPLYLLPLAKRNEKRAELLLIEKRAAEEAWHTAEQQTELAERQAQIAKEQTAKAELASAAKTEFLATMSHELRTPLAGIAGINEILLENSSLNPEVRRLLLQQRDAASLMLSSVNDILDISKIEVGEMETESIPFSLARAVDEIVNGLRYQAESKGLHLLTQIDAKVPVTVIGSPFHLTRIVQNLVGNAIKFTREGGVLVRLRSVARRDAGDDQRHRVRIDVEDTGIGIPKAAQAHIFERFYQVDASVTRKFGGTGLGTTIVKEFAALLGGAVSVDSEEGVGSRFSVEVAFEIPAIEAQSKGPRPQLCLLAADLSPEQSDLLGDVMSRLGDDRGKALSFVHDAIDIAAKMRDPGPGAAQRLPAVVGTYRTHWQSLYQGLADEGVVAPPAIVLATLPEFRDKQGQVSRRRVDPWMPRTTIWIDDLSSASASLEAARAILQTEFEARQAERDEAIGGSDARAHGSGESGATRAPADMRILIAEDSTVIQVVFNHLLAEFAHVTMVGDGARALAIANVSPFDVVILDYHMPAMSGVDVVKAVRAGNGPNQATKILFATAAPTPEVIDEVKRAGADAVIGKPFKRDTLFGALKQLAAPAASEAPEPQSTLPLIDDAVLDTPDSLFVMGNLIPLRDSFLHDCERNAAAIARSCATGDFRGFREAIHAYVGVTATYGAMRLDELLRSAPKTEAEFAARGKAAGEAIVRTSAETTKVFADWCERRAAKEQLAATT